MTLFDIFPIHGTHSENRHEVHPFQKCGIAPEREWEHKGLSAAMINEIKLSAHIAKDLNRK